MNGLYKVEPFLGRAEQAVRIQPGLKPGAEPRSGASCSPEAKPGSAIEH